MSTLQDNGDDSDLEIIPNPKPSTSNILDLCENDDKAQSVIDDMRNEQQKRQQYSKKRPITSIKKETSMYEPSIKRRKLINNQSNKNKTVKEEQKEIEITQK
eukprot:473696_1